MASAYMIVILVAVFSLTDAFLTDVSTTEQKVAELQNEVLIVHKELVRLCPDHQQKSKRDIESIELEMVQEHLRQLKEELKQCKLSQTTTTVATTTVTTTTVATTTVVPPSECLTATHLNQSWRNYMHHGKITGLHHIYNGHACDLYQELQWFRFTKPAGSRMLDHCVDKEYCGTYLPYWTNATMPSMIGVVTSIKAYAPDTMRKCDGSTLTLNVMRCPEKGGDYYIYKYTGYHWEICFQAFCGM